MWPTFVTVKTDAKHLDSLLAFSGFNGEYSKPPFLRNC